MRPQSSASLQAAQHDNKDQLDKRCRPAQSNGLALRYICHSIIDPKTKQFDQAFK